MHDKRKNIAPAYSFGVKHKNFTNNHSPGPKFNIEGIWFNFILSSSSIVWSPYRPQSLVVHGQPSNWTMKASLTRHGRSGAPHYSLYSRTQSAKAFNTPGPGTYRNEKVTVVHKGAPKYSLSSRAKSGGTSKTPGTFEIHKIIETINLKKNNNYKIGLKLGYFDYSDLYNLYRPDFL